MNRHLAIAYAVAGLSVAVATITVAGATTGLAHADPPAEQAPATSVPLPTEAPLPAAQAPQEAPDPAEYADPPRATARHEGEDGDRDQWEHEGTWEHGRHAFQRSPELDNPVRAPRRFAAVRRGERDED